MAKTYNGHPSHALWNVALWFANDEGLYNMARGEIRRARTKDIAAQRIFEFFADCGIAATPDGVRYSLTNIRYALRGLD